MDNFTDVLSAFNCQGGLLAVRKIQFEGTGVLTEGLGDQIGGEKGG